MPRSEKIWHWQWNECIRNYWEIRVVLSSPTAVGTLRVQDVVYGSQQTQPLVHVSAKDKKKKAGVLEEIKEEPEPEQGPDTVVSNRDGGGWRCCLRKVLPKMRRLGAASAESGYALRRLAWC